MRDDECLYACRFVAGKGNPPRGSKKNLLPDLQRNGEVLHRMGERPEADEVCPGPGIVPDRFSGNAAGKFYEHLFPEPGICQYPECLLYLCRSHVVEEQDIGTGPGYFLSAVEKYLPSRKSVFYGIEKFPPPEQYRVKSENYIIGNIASLPGKFDCGMCIEVLEHLTPNMVKTLFADLARISTPGALYIFNTGMPEYVLKENPAYLDPFNRGHIASYSVEAIKILAEKTGFTIFPIRGKTWAFVAEYMSKSNAREDITDRIWKPVESNLRILSDAEMGSVLKILGLETARAYLTL